MLVKIAKNSSRNSARKLVVIQSIAPRCFGVICAWLERETISDCLQKVSKMLISVEMFECLKSTQEAHPSMQKILAGISETFQIHTVLIVWTSKLRIPSAASRSLVDMNLEVKVSFHMWVLFRTVSYRLPTFVQFS